MSTNLEDATIDGSIAACPRALVGVELAPDMQKGTLALAAVALLLAGCAQAPAQGTGTASHATSAQGTSAATVSATQAPSSAPAARPAPSSSPAPSRMSIHGVVLDEALHPLAANVTILE